jgi:hypothetical protein
MLPLLTRALDMHHYSKSGEACTNSTEENFDGDYAELDQLEYELNNMRGSGVVAATEESNAAEAAAFERALDELERWAAADAAAETADHDR